MKCDILYKALKSKDNLKEIEEHILNCPQCEKYLEESLNFKYLNQDDFQHSHNNFFEKFSDEPFGENTFKGAISCPLCFNVLITYQKGIKLIRKKPSKKILKNVIKAPFREENLTEKISSIVLSLILFFVLAFATITRGNLSLTFTKLETFYAETKGKTLGIYGKLLGYGANKLKEEDKNEMHKSQ